MKVTGDKRHKERLRRMADPKVRRDISRGIFVAAQEVQTEARLLITEGSISGAGHIASLPGEPPNNDTGHLAGNIEATRTGDLSAQVESKADYGAELERGTSKMAARPYMAPALQRKRKRILELTHGVVEAAIK